MPTLVPATNPTVKLSNYLIVLVNRRVSLQGRDRFIAVGIDVFPDHRNLDVSMEFEVKLPGKAKVFESGIALTVVHIFSDSYLPGTKFTK